MAITPTVFINFKKKKSDIVINDIQKDFLLESFSIIRDDLYLQTGKRITFDLKIEDVSDMETFINEYYIDNKVVRNLSYFKNMVLYAAHPSRAFDHIADVKYYLGYNIDFLKEIEMIKVNEIIEVLGTYAHVNEKLICELSKEKDDESFNYNEILKKKYEAIENFDCYDLLLESINNILGDHRQVDFNINNIREKLVTKGYYTEMIDGKIDIMIYEEGKIDDSIEKGLKTFLLENYLDVEINNRAASRLIVEYLDDVEEIISDLITGIFDRHGSGLEFYQQIKYEILTDNTLDLDDLLCYIAFSNFSVDYNGNHFTVYYKNNYA